MNSWLKDQIIKRHNAPISHYPSELSMANAKSKVPIRHNQWEGVPAWTKTGLEIPFFAVRLATGFPLSSAGQTECPSSPKPPGLVTFFP
jgi:hypothetical protein